jgi:hypothetical protein
LHGNGFNIRRTAVAQRTIVQLVSDLSGEEIGAEEGRSIEFAYDGVTYRIDLTVEEAEAFDEAIAPYVEAASQLSGSRRRPGRQARSARRGGSGRDTRAIREWANANGYKVGDRGRIPSDIVEAYDAAN